MLSGRQQRRIVVALLLLLLICTAIPQIRESILRAAGRMLVVNECSGRADIIVVSGEADGAGILKASDLVHQGVAARVGVFTYRANATEREFARRGIPNEDRTTRLMRQLKAVGFVDADRIPEEVTGTEDEGPALARWCDEQHFHSVVVVGNSDHTRRLRRVFHRALKGHETKVTVCPTPYTGFDPDRWWKSRDGIRTEIMESEKLLLDIVRHPIS